MTWIMKFSHTPFIIFHFAFDTLNTKIDIKKKRKCKDIICNLQQFDVFKALVSSLIQVLAVENKKRKMLSDVFQGIEFHFMTLNVVYIESITISVCVALYSSTGFQF